MKSNMPAFQIPNFSRDTGPLSLKLAGLMVLLSAAMLGAAILVTMDQMTLEEQRLKTETLKEKLALKVADMRRQEEKAPSLGAFEQLRNRITRLNQLDFGATLSIGEMLDTLEMVLPDQVMITSLRYDRARGSVDLAAVSASSTELTRFFEALHKVDRFSRTRLAEKLLLTTGIEPRTQIRIYIEVGEDGHRELKS